MIYQNKIKTLQRKANTLFTKKGAISNKLHFLKRKIRRNSTFNLESEMEMCSLFPEKILEEILLLFKPKSVLDLGCGKGASLDFFLARGIAVKGIEGSTLAISQARNPKLIFKYNLNKELNLNEKFDLVWSFEFIEHIHPKYVPNLINTFSNHSDTLILSAAHPGQWGVGHFNEQNDKYWIEKFKTANYYLNAEATARLRSLDEIFSQNMYVFERNKIWKQ